MYANPWQLQEAKSRFSQLVDQAMHHKPQVVSKHGKNAVVVLAFDDYEKLTTPQTGLVSFLRNSPLAQMGTEIDLDIDRQKDLPRDIAL